MKAILKYRLFIAVTLLAHCKVKYDPPAVSTDAGYLVVDGFLNNSADTTFIRLSHTRKPDSNLLNSGEKNATITIEDNEGNTLYNLKESGSNGSYTLPGMNLDINNKYRLRIKTTNGKEYLSDEITVKQTPAIDSINWVKDDRGVTIYVNAHDNTGSTKYYRWEYTETYQYHSTLISRYKYDVTASYHIGGRPDSEFIYTCWKTNKTPALLLATSEKLSADIISQNPIRFISSNSVELSVKYSILLKQYALTKEAYTYLQNLRKFTELTGSVFDAQPLEITGNVHAVNNANEPVLGYVTACNMQSMRIYITNEQVAPWTFNPYCTKILVPKNTDSIDAYFAGGAYIPIDFYNSSPLSPIYGALKECADCRVLGGTTIKPDFWP